MFQFPLKHNFCSNLLKNQNKCLFPFRIKLFSLKLVVELSLEQHLKSHLLSITRNINNLTCPLTRHWHPYGACPTVKCIFNSFHTETRVSSVHIQPKERCLVSQLTFILNSQQTLIAYRI